MKVAILGATSGVIDPDTQFKLLKDDVIIVDREEYFIIDERETSVSPYIERWAKEHRIPIIQMDFKPYVYKGDYENDYWGSHIAWYKDIVRNSDRIIVYCDDDYVYRDLYMFIIGYAFFLNKEVEMVKLKPMQFFTFSIGCSDDRYNECYFTIRIDQDIPEDTAREMAIMEAKKRFSAYCKKHSVVSTYELSILTTGYNGTQFWKEVVE